MSSTDLTFTEPASPADADRAARLVWINRDDVPLNHGLPMTASEALDYAAAGATNGHSFRQTAGHEIRWTSGFGTKCVYTGHWPEPTDVPTAIRELDEHLQGLGWDAEHRALLIDAAQAAYDGADTKALDLLKQVVAMPIRDGR